MSASVVIRPYEPRDRDALRRIACDTAERGQPVERFFRDREVFADLVTRYYTDDEPQTAWAAECEGRVIGYLTGCLDTPRYRRVMIRRVIPRVILKAIAHGALVSGEMWRLLGAGVVTWLGGGCRRQTFLRCYPAHLHVNVQEGFRGQRVGRRLVERFYEQARAAGCEGVHAVVREDNQPACRFFEWMGFAILSRRTVTMLGGRGFRQRQAAIYGKRL